MNLGYNNKRSKGKNFMFEYKTKNIDLKEILNYFIDFFPYFKDPSNHCLIYHNSKLGYVKNKNNKIIAALLYREYNEFPYILELGHIKVFQEYRSKGIASKLLEYILLDIKQNKGKKVIVHISQTNKIAQKFYTKNNFIKEGTIKNMKLGKEGTIKNMKLGKEDLYLYALEL
jgi:ribosomal protein S18 acetylase RimI-like enzyme